jgi:hypothetical protein
MRLFKLLRSLPAIGPAIRIANSYAFQGDYRSDKEFAGFRRWLKAFGPEFLVSLSLTTATMWPYIESSWAIRSFASCPDQLFYCTPGALAVSVVPSTLGFGIGIYALIFTLTNSFVKDIQKHIDVQKEQGKRSAGSELVLNADLALPLLALLLALVLGILQQAFPASIALIAIAWLFTWFSMISLLGLISVIFGLAEHSLLDKAR